MQQNCRKIASFLLKGRRNTQIYHVFANSAFVHQNWVKKRFGKPFKSTDTSHFRSMSSNIVEYFLPPAHWEGQVRDILQALLVPAQGNGKMKHSICF